MEIPSNPILLPKPKIVTCPKCSMSWVWRSWYKGGKKTTCSKCKNTVVPTISDPAGSGIGEVRLIRCSHCGGLQWYSGDKKKTSCTNPECGRKNITVREVDKEELKEILRAEGCLGEPYYAERLREF